MKFKSEQPGHYGACQFVKGITGAGEFETNDKEKVKKIQPLIDKGIIVKVKASDLSAAEKKQFGLNKNQMIGKGLLRQKKYQIFNET